MTGAWTGFGVDPSQGLWCITAMHKPGWITQITRMWEATVQGSATGCEQGVGLMLRAWDDVTGVLKGLD